MWLERRPVSHCWNYSGDDDDGDGDDGDRDDVDDNDGDDGGDGDDDDDDVGDDDNDDDGNDDVDDDDDDDDDDDGNEDHDDDDHMIISMKMTITMTMLCVDVGDERHLTNQMHLHKKLSNFILALTAYIQANLTARVPSWEGDQPSTEKLKYK